MALVESVSLSYAVGDDLEMQFDVTDDDGVAVDLTGMEVRFAVARQVGDDPVIGTELDTPNATVIGTNLAGGIFRIAVAGEETEGLSGTYRFECDIEDGDGRVSTVSHGFITFKRGLLA